MFWETGIVVILMVFIYIIYEHNYLKAETMYDFVLNQRIKIYGKDKLHLDIAHSYDNFGSLYGDMNYLNTAELLFLKALDLKLKICCNEPHPEVAKTKYNLGTVYVMQCLYEKAIKQFEESLLIMRKVHKGYETHPIIIDYKQNLHIARTRAQLELFREEKEINLFNIFRDNCRIFGYLNPETQLSLIYFNEYMNNIDLCIYVKYLLTILYVLFRPRRESIFIQTNPWYIYIYIYKFTYNL